MADDPRLTPLAASLPATVPFVGPETQQRQRGADFAARLGANENVFGPSPAAIDAMQAAAAQVWMYGDAEAYLLKQALAALHGTAPEHLLIGEGIDGLLGYLVRLVVSPGDAVVTSEGAYPTFNYHVAGYGGVIHKVPYRDDHADTDALAHMARETGAKLVYIANPDNPMGSWHGPDAIGGLIDALPEGCLLVLDEAYAECAPSGSLPDVSPQDPRVITMRTFSKVYGLAGLRVGYAIGSVPLISAFDRVRNHFGVGRLAQAGALAALEDRDWLAKTLRRIAEARDEIGRISRAHGLVPLPSAANFVAVDCGRDGAFARAVLAALGELGVFVRMPGVAPLDRCIRISCGSPRDLAVLDKALPGALAAARESLDRRNSARSR